MTEYSQGVLLIEARSSAARHRPLRIAATRALTASVLAVLVQPAASAQEVQVASNLPAAGIPASTGTGSAEASASEGEIVVTAQKRIERLQDVPIAVAVVGSAQLANSDVKELTQLNALVPGLNVAAALGAFNPTIRGIGTSSNVVENPVALYIDGVYMPNQREGLRDLADVEQVTVLKGPQGTLFGRNATAGVIQITTREPSFTTKGALTAGYESYQTFRGSAYLTGGLAENVAASASVSFTTQGEGYGRSLTSGFDTYQLKHNLSLRGKILFTPGDRTRITLIGDYLDRADTGRTYQPYPGTSFTYPGFGPVGSRYDTYAGTPGYDSFKSRGVSVEIDHDLDFAKLSSISSYRRGTGGFKFDYTNVAAPFIISTASQTNEDYTEEVQLISPSGRKFQWVTGVFYIHNTIGYDHFDRDFLSPSPFAALPTSTSRLESNTFETTESVAPFAQADYEILPRTKLTLGGRFTYERRQINGGNTVTLVNGRTIFVPAVTPSVLTIEKPTWRLALDHNFTDDVSAYVSYNRGIKSGGFNIATPTSPAYLPETLDDYEVGFKSQLFDRRLTLNAAAFYYKYQNLQVTTFINGTSPTVTNGAKAELYGLDVDFQAKLTPELSLNGGFEVLHAAFTSYQNAALSSPRASGGVQFVIGDATGKRLPASQNFVGTLAVDYARPIGSLNAHFNVTGTYNGDYFLEADNFLRQPAYVMLNSSIRLSDRTDRVSLTFAVNNILDKAIISNINTQPFAYFVNYGFPPRIYSVTAGFRF